jgi:hypothetical protein
MADVICVVATVLPLLTLWRNARDEHFGLIMTLTVGVVVFWIAYFCIRYRPIKTGHNRRRESE